MGNGKGNSCERHVPERGAARIGLDGSVEVPLDAAGQALLVDHEGHSGELRGSERSKFTTPLMKIATSLRYLVVPKADR